MCSHNNAWWMSNIQGHFLMDRYALLHVIFTTDNRPRQTRRTLNTFHYKVIYLERAKLDSFECLSLPRVEVTGTERNQTHHQHIATFNTVIKKGNWHLQTQLLTDVCRLPGIADFLSFTASLWQLHHLRPILIQSVYTIKVKQILIFFRWIEIGNFQPCLQHEEYLSQHYCDYQ